MSDQPVHQLLSVRIPLLRSDGVPTETLTLTAYCSHHIDVDDRRIPVGVTAVEGTDWDLRRGRVVSDLELDDSWCGLTPADGGSIHTLRAPDGRMVALWADRAFGFVHAFITREFPSRAGFTTAIALEPMTAAANALNSGSGCDGCAWATPSQPRGRFATRSLRRARASDSPPCHSGRSVRQSLTNHGDPPHLVDIRVRRDDVNFVGADVSEFLRSSSDFGPSSESNEYDSVTSTIGRRRRAALTESFSRVSSFSFTSSSARAFSHSARDTIGGMKASSVMPAACHSDICR